MLDQVIDYVPVIFFAKEEDEQNDSDAPIDDLEYEEGFVVPVCGTEPLHEKWCTLNELLVKIVAPKVCITSLLPQKSNWHPSERRVPRISCKLVKLT